MPPGAPPPSAVLYQPPSSAYSYGGPTPGAPIPTPGPAPAPSWGWQGQPPQPPPQQGYPYGYGGYAPGARVQVTWANGQKYPATVQRVQGTQCLVVFPDGQQRWVDTTYLTPG
jgi:hypothetical protein